MNRRLTSVLVVEDNPGDARLIQEYLRDSPTIDAKITLVVTLESALDSLQRTSYDVVLERI